LLLSTPPTTSTLEHARTYLEELRNPKKPTGGLTWAQILAEDPLEGQHWEGAYGLPPGSTVEDWETRGDSDSDASALSDEDFELDLDLEPPPSDLGETSASSTGDTSGQELGDITVEEDLTTRIKDAYAHKKAVEELEKKQYWQDNWKSDIHVDVGKKFNIGDVSTFGSSDESQSLIL
jgi:gamma-tubulin complex component 5